MSVLGFVLLHIEQDGVKWCGENPYDLLLLLLESLHILLCSFELGKAVLSPVASAS